VSNITQQIVALLKDFTEEEKEFALNALKQIPGLRSESVHARAKKDKLDKQNKK